MGRRSMRGACTRAGARDHVRLSLVAVRIMLSSPLRYTATAPKPGQAEAHIAEAVRLAQDAITRGFVGLKRHWSRPY